MTGPRVVMLLGNACAPDPRVEAEARALAAAGASVVILGWDRDGDHPEVEVRDGVRVQRIRLPSTHGRGSSQALQMPRIWSRFVSVGKSLQPDVVHAHDLDTLPAAWRLARATGASLVFDAHESYSDMLGENVSKAIKTICRALERFLVPRADLLVTVGERLRRHYQDMGAKLTQVVGNWRDPIDTDGGPAAVRQAVRVDAGVKESTVFICFIANLTPERRLEPLLEAVESVPGVELVVGGRGAGVQAAEQAAARCDRIRFVGLVAPSDVARWTAAADAVYYGFDPDNPNARFSAPNKLFEALAAGIPVVTARFGEIGEIVADTGCGILLADYSTESIADALRELLDESRRAELCKAARAASTRYTRAAADRALVDAYRSLPRSAGWDLRSTLVEAA